MGKAFENAKKAELLKPDEISIKILRLEAGIRMAVEKSSNQDKASLEKFSKELSDLRSKYPAIVDIRILQAIIAEYSGQTENAIKELKQAIADCNDTLDAEMLLAGLYQKNKQTDEAVKICENARKNHQDSAKPWLRLSEIYLADANDEQAREYLKKGLDSVTSKIDKHSISIRLALLELLRGDRNTGIKLLRDIAAQDERDIEARLMLLELREVQQDTEETEKLIAQIRQIEGQAGLRWRFYTARLLLSSEQWSEKNQEISNLLQSCISADPGWSAPVLLLVDLYKKQGDIRRIEDICRQALARNPSASDIANELLKLYESQRRFADAEKILQQVDTNQNMFNAWQIKMALNTGDIESAVNKLELRISNNKTDATSRIQLARLIYQQTKDTAKAFVYLDEAKNIADSNSIADKDTKEAILRAVTGTRAAILRADGQADEALKIINDYVAAHDNLYAYHMRGQYYTGEGKYELAEQDYRKLTTLDGSDAASYELLSNFFAGIKQIDKAISAIEEGLVKFPENLSLNRNLMKLLIIQGPTQNLSLANNLLKELEADLPQDSEITKFKAALLLEKPTAQSIETARQMLEKLIKLDSTEVDAYRMLISIAAMEKRYDTARDYASQALGANPGNPALMTIRSKIELEAGNPQMAAELANLILQKYTDNSEARDIYVKAALISRDRVLLKEAGNLLESAIAGSPKDENLRITKANVLMVMDQSNTAISELESFCLTEPGSVSIPALVTLAELYGVTGDISKAEQKVNLAANIDSNNLFVVHSRFQLLVAQKKYNELSQISKSYIAAKNPNSELILRAASLLVSLESKELKQEGLKLFEYAVTLSPDSADTKFSFASALYGTGNIERAEIIYKELLDKFPNDVRVINDYAWILQENMKDYTKALELANKGLKLAPNDLHLLDTRGTILFKSGNQLDQAKKDFSKLAESSPSGSRQQAKAFFNLGRVCVKLNNPDEAKKHFQRALEINEKLNIFTPAELEEIKNSIK